MSPVAMSVFFLLVLGQDGVRGQSDETTDCSKPLVDFKILTKECCKTTTHGPLFSNQNLESALNFCGQTPQLLEWANSYKLNTLQSKGDSNFINIKNENNIKTLCPIAIFMNCVFTKGKLLTIRIGNTLYPNELLKMMLQTIGIDWQESITQIISPIKTFEFSEIVMEPFKKIKCPTGEVSLLPLLLMQVIQSELIWICPEAQDYTLDNNCLARMKEFQYCDGKIYDTMGKGVIYFKNN